MVTPPCSAHIWNSPAMFGATSDTHTGLKNVKLGIQILTQICSQTQWNKDPTWVIIWNGPYSLRENEKLKNI